MNAKRLLSVAIMLLPIACGGSQQADSQAVDSGPHASAAIQSSTASSNETAAAPASGQERLMLAQAEAPSPTAAGQSRFRMGEHYNRLSPTQPTSSSPDKVEVAEIFWYGCPHCYTFDPYLESWRSRTPPYVSFVRIPAVWNPVLQLHARAFYTAEALGKSEEMHQAFFREMHVNGNFLQSERAMQDFFAKFGVDEEAFKSAWNSFAVHTKLQRADELSRRYRISSVPTVVVNGKYTTNASMAGSYDDLMALIDDLAAQEAAAN